jgi:hypothetical protein
MQAVQDDSAAATRRPVDSQHADDREAEPVADGEEQAPEETGYGYGV